ncbi:MAG TPA: AtpZ/AtpI family protein [Longimicrobiaceae bacterium]
MAQIPSSRGPQRPDVPGAAQYAGLGVVFAGGIVLFTLLGNWVDGRWGTAPWGVLLGVFGGFAASLTWVYRRLVVEPRERAKRERP